MDRPPLCGQKVTFPKFSISYSPSGLDTGLRLLSSSNFQIMAYYYSPYTFSYGMTKSFLPNYSRGSSYVPLDRIITLEIRMLHKLNVGLWVFRKKKAEGKNASKKYKLAVENGRQECAYQWKLKRSHLKSQIYLLKVYLTIVECDLIRLHRELRIRVSYEHEVIRRMENLMRAPPDIHNLLTIQDIPDHVDFSRMEEIETLRRLESFPILRELTLPREHQSFVLSLVALSLSPSSSSSSVPSLPASSEEEPVSGGAPRSSSGTITKHLQLEYAPSYRQQ